MHQLRNQVLTWGKDSTSFEKVKAVFHISGKKEPLGYKQFAVLVYPASAF